MGAFWALININSLPMVYDLGDEKQIGSYTGLYYFASSAAAIAGPVVAGVLIDLEGRNYSVLWIFSAIFLAIAAFLMTRIHVKNTALAIEPLSP
jgi:MFS family permease